MSIGAFRRFPTRMVYLKHIVEIHHSGREPSKLCMYLMTMYSAVRMPLVSNCAIYIRFIISFTCSF